MKSPHPTIESVINNKINETLFAHNTFKIGKIISKAENGTYNIQLINVIKKNDKTVKPTQLIEVPTLKLGTKDKSVKIEYNIQDYVVIGFLDIDYNDWFNGSDIVIDDIVNNALRHSLSSGFIIGRLTRNESNEPSISLIRFLQEITSNLLESLQEIRNITAIDSLSAPVTFTNINNLDNNIIKMQQSLNDIVKIFE